MSRVIFHIDMNAYFASVARALKHELCDVPVAVSGNLADNGIIVSATYDARANGVKATMHNKEALAICPELVIVETDFESYKRYTKLFFEIIKEYSVFIEPASIDECYVDVSEVIKKFKRPLDLAWIIQNRILNELKLPCSIGVASNKFLAKMASDMKKPLGICVLRKNQIAEKLWPLSIYDMYGIGQKTATILAKNNINTIGDLANEDNHEKIKNLVGNMASKFILNAQGFDTSELSYNQSIQSISQSKTYIRELSLEDEIILELQLLCRKIIQRAQEKHNKGKHISLSIRYSNMKSVIRSITIYDYTNDYNVLIQEVLKLFEKHFQQMPVKLLGVSLGSLINSNNIQQQLSIFEEPKIDIVEQLNQQLTTGKLIYLKDLKNEN